MVDRHMSTVTEAMAKKKILEKKRIELRFKMTQNNDEIQTLEKKNGEVEA